MSPRRRDSAATRELIVEAAATAFATRGYTGVTVREVAAAAEVDPALVMRYFGSKAQLFAHAMGAGGPMVAAIGGGPVDELPRRVAAYLAGKTAGPSAGEAGDRALSMLVLSVADADGRALLAATVREHLEGPLAAALVAAGRLPGRATRQARAVALVVVGHGLVASTMPGAAPGAAELEGLLTAALALP